MPFFEKILQTFMDIFSQVFKGALLMYVTFATSSSFSFIQVFWL